MNKLITFLISALWLLLPVQNALAVYPNLGKGATLTVSGAGTPILGSSEVQFEGGMTTVIITGKEPVPIGLAADFLQVRGIALDEAVSVEGAIKVPANHPHFGKRVNLFAVGFVSPTGVCSGKSADGQYYMLLNPPIDNKNQSGLDWYDEWTQQGVRNKSFEEWDGSLSSLKPFALDVELRETTPVTVMKNSKFNKDMEGKLCITFGYRVVGTGTEEWVFNENTVDVIVTFHPTATAIAATTLNKGEEITDASGGLKVKSVSETPVTVQVTEGIDQDGDKTYQFEIEGGEVEITLPEIVNTEENQGNRRAIRASTDKQYPVDKRWVTTQKYYLFGNRLPESKQVLFTIKATNVIVIEGTEKLGNYRLKIAQKIASALEASCSDHDDGCFADREPVLFIHGFQPDIGTSLGGGSDTWNDFPRLLQELGYVPFAFRWRTSARFEDVANDLGKAIDLINQKTGRQVHIVAHSFGGLLTRTWLQNLASLPSTPKATGKVASVTTLGTPHSGIADSDKCLSSMPFPKGQDVYYLAWMEFGFYDAPSDSFEGCKSLTCREVGEEVDILVANPSFSLLLTPFPTPPIFDSEGTFFESGKAGDFIAKLARFESGEYALPEVDILVQIGMTKGYPSLPESVFLDTGDALITFEGQRFSPAYTVTGNCSDVIPRNPDEPLKNKAKVGNASLTEVILGFDSTARPKTSDYKFSSGYTHTRQDSEWKGPAEAHVVCDSATNCNHHGFQNTVEWLKDHPAATTVGITSISYVGRLSTNKEMSFQATITLGDEKGHLVKDGNGKPVILDITTPSEISEDLVAFYFEQNFHANKEFSIIIEAIGYEPKTVYLTMGSTVVGDTCKGDNWETSEIIALTGLCSGYAPALDDTIRLVPSPLTKVTGLKATPGNKEVKLSWDTVKGATSYSIHWKTTEGVEQVISASTTSYTHTGLTNGKTYIYRVTATMSDGKETDSSSEVSVTLLEIEVPEKEPLVLDPEKNEVTLTFNIPTKISQGADIAFIVDQSSSYSGDIATFKAKAKEMVEAFDEFGKSVQYALVGFVDYPTSGSRDFPYQLHQPLTSNLDDFTAAINGLSIYDGDDVPESQLEAVYKTVEELNWRSGSLRVIFLATDASFHNSDKEEEYPGHGYDETLLSLKGKGIVVYGLASENTPDLTQLAEATGGSSYSLSSNSEEIIGNITNALVDLETSGQLILVPDNSLYIESITPERIDISKMSSGNPVQFTVIFKREPLSGGSKQVEFSLFLQTDRKAFLEKQPVVLRY